MDIKGKTIGYKQIESLLSVFKNRFRVLLVFVSLIILVMYGIVDLH